MPPAEGRTAFFYGTLMAPPVLHRVIHGSPTPQPWQSALITIRPAILHRHRRHRVLDCDYPAIIPTPSDPSTSVRGSLVTGLNDQDIRRLDTFEGSEYERGKVNVRVLETTDTGGDPTMGEGTGEKGEGIEAETYIWKGGFHDLEDEEWDFETFRKQRMMAWAGLGGGEDGEPEDEGFRDVDEMVERERGEGRGKAVGKDPTGGRAWKGGGAITSQLNGMDR